MKFTLRDILNSLFRYSRALFIFWVVVLIASLVFYSQSRKTYDSKAKILVSLGTEALGKADYLSAKNIQLLQREQQIHNEQQILESHEVMLTTARWILGERTPGFREPARDAKLEETKRYLMGQESPPSFLFGIVKGFTRALGSLFSTPKSDNEKLEDLTKSLSESLSVKPIFDSDALDVTFTSCSPTVAQTALTLVIDSYLKHHIAVFQNNAEADLLKAQLERSVNSYHQRLGEFSSFMNAHGVYNDDAQLNALIDQREKLKQQMNAAVADNEAASARLASLASIQNSLHQLDRYSTIEVRNKERDALLAKLDDAVLEERTLLTRHPKGSRADEEQQAKLEELRRLVQQEPERVVEETEERKSKASEFVESEVINVTEVQHGDQARIDSLRTDLRAKDAEISNFATNLKGFNSLKLDLNFAKQESEQMAQVYVGSRLKTLTAQSAITDISIIDVPTWDPNPATPTRKAVLLATLALLVAGSLALLFACITLDTTVADGATAEFRLGTPVAAMIPLTRRPANAEYFPDYFIEQNQGEFACLYQSLRGQGQRQRGKVILVAESSPKEGASLIGCSLARFLSRYAGEKAVFIDRTTNPVIDSLNAVDRGMNESAVMAWPGAGASASGGVVNDAVPVLSKLRDEFAYVVVSAGAVKGATDLLQTSGIVNAVFFIVEAGKTRSWAARYNLELLQRYGFKDVQLILNKRIFYIPNWLIRFA